MQFIFTFHEKEDCIQPFAAPSPHTPFFADEIIALRFFRFRFFSRMAGIVLHNQPQTSTPLG